MRMQPQRYDDEPALAPVIPLFRHMVDFEDDEFDADGESLILRFADEPSVS